MKRIDTSFRRARNYTLVLSGFGAAVPCAPVFAAPSDGAAGKTECVQVDRARIVTSTGPSEKKFGKANLGHQIGAGQGIVLAVRRFDDPDLGPDGGIFSKTTIELAKMPAEIESGEDVIVPVVHSFYAEGASAFVAKGAYAWSIHPLRKVHIKKESDGLRLLYSEEIAARDAATGKSKSIRLKVDCPLRNMRARDLSLWHGYPATNWQSFFPPGTP